MSQLSFSDIEFTQKRYKTRKEQFLERMEKAGAMGRAWSLSSSLTTPNQAGGVGLMLYRACSGSIFCNSGTT